MVQSEIIQTALADKVHKQEVLHSDMHSITWPHLFNNHPYIASSGTPVIYCYLYMYIGMVVEYFDMAMIWNAYH